MKKSLKYVLILGVLLPMVIGALSAQTPVLKKQVIGNGGCLNAKNNQGVTMSGTLGQLAIMKLSASEASGNTYNVYQGFWVPEPAAVVGVEDNVVSSDKQLMNYPNPFSTSTAIKYELKAPAYVSLKVYDMTGSEVKTVFNGYQGAGAQEIFWDAKNAQGMEVGSGSYVYEVVVRPADMAGSNSFAEYNLRNVMIVVK